MSSTLKSLRALSDPTRLRIVALLERDELSVAELQEITRLGQSRISTHLGLLADCALVQSRRDGKRTFYKLNQNAEGAARRIHPARHPRREGTRRTRRRPNQSQARARPPQRSRRRFFSIKSPDALIASMDRAARGRRSDICCCAFCRRSSSPTWARAKVC